MRLRSNTGAGQPVALIMTRMATALARIRPRRVLRETLVCIRKTATRVTVTSEQQANFDGMPGTQAVVARTLSLQLSTVQGREASWLDEGRASKQRGLGLYVCASDRLSRRHPTGARAMVAGGRGAPTARWRSSVSIAAQVRAEARKPAARAGTGGGSSNRWWLPCAIGQGRAGARGGKPVHELRGAGHHAHSTDDDPALWTGKSQ